MEIILMNQTGSKQEAAPTTRVPVSSPAPPLVDTTELLNSTSLSEREQMRVEFFRTYDVMTGVRIAATLGGFFGLMVLLVIYKSKCKSKSLSDEHLNAAAAAAVEEEDNELAATLEAAAFLSMNPRVVRGARRSLGNMSAPAMVLTRGARLSSIGGYTSLEPPACFYYQRGKSLPGSALRFARQESYCEEDEVGSPPPEPEPPYCYRQHLAVPADHRRLSSITCSSADTSYLERKGSACEMGLPPPPPFIRKDSEKRCLDRSALTREPWDFYYPIDIQVIQPTPEMSPCGSERTLYDDPIPIRSRARSSGADSISSVTLQRLAPLASISSLAVTRAEYPHDQDSRSVGSDSVFLDDDDDLDTEDEVDGFATDSEEEKPSPLKSRRLSHLDRSDSTACVAYTRHLQVPEEGVRVRRRLSVPSCRSRPSRRQAKASTSSLVMVRTESPSCSHSLERLHVEQRPPQPLPVEDDTPTNPPDNQPTLENCTSSSPTPTPTPTPVSDCRSWSQETFF